MMRWLVMLLVASAVSGCASAPPQLAAVGLNQTVQERFELDGRLAVRYRDDSSTALIHWQHHPEDDNLVLSSPLGQTLTTLVRDANGVSLTDSQQNIHQAANVAALTEKLLGWQLPLENLSYWVVGHAVPGTSYQLQQDTEHGVTQLTQAGWVVIYNRWQQVSGVILPDKLTLVGPGVEVRLVIGGWKLVGAK